MNIDKNVCVSVIIPVYNSETRIKICLDSVKKQTFENFEVIIINDGSTDNSLNIIDAFCESDSRFRVISTSNQGVSAARNLGIKYSEGDYIALIDSDDVLNESYLQCLYENIRKTNSDIAFVDIMYSSRQFDSVRIDKDRCMTAKEFIQGSFCNIKTGHLIGAPFAKMIRKSLIVENNIWYEV
jgi:glycosyltransferase involved in cell wall biosynthesis